MLEKISKKLNSLSYIKLVLLILGILILKFGFSPIGIPYVEWLRETARHFPTATTYLVSSPAPLFFMRIFNYPSAAIWWLWGSLLFVVWILLTLTMISKRFPDVQREYSIIFLLSTPVACSLSLIGHIDIYTLIGGSLLALGTSRVTLLCGAVLGVCGNADMGLAITLLLAILAYGKFNHAKVAFGFWAPVSIALYGILHFLIKLPVNSDPVRVVFLQMKMVSLNSLGSLPLYFYSVLGPIWIIALLIYWPILNSKRERISALLAMVALPFAMSTLILDGTRMGVTASFVGILILLQDARFRVEVKSKFISGYQGALIMTLVLVPTVVVDQYGLLRLPIRKLLESAHLIG